MQRQATVFFLPENLSTEPLWSTLVLRPPGPSTPEDLWPYNITMHTDTMVNLCVCVWVCVSSEGSGGGPGSRRWMAGVWAAGRQQTGQPEESSREYGTPICCLSALQLNTNVCICMQASTRTHAQAHTKLFYYNCLWLAIFGTLYNHSHP